MLLLTRESESTRREQYEWKRGIRIRRPVSNVSNVIVTLADGTVEYLSGCKCNIIRSYLKHRETGNEIISLRSVCQPLHLLNERN